MRAVHQFTQGSGPWLAHRARIFNASEAPAVMGASKYTSRAALLREKATGIVPEVGPATQALFDRGHAVEKPTIAMIEGVIGDSLAPVVASIEVDGLVLGASYDGLTMLEDTGAEIKLWNEELAAQIRAGTLEPHYFWQLEHQFIVTPSLERIIFATSDGTPGRFVWMEYLPVPGRREQMLGAWRQFREDLAAYVPREAPPKLVAEAVEALPSVSVQVTGQLVVADNFPLFEQRLRAFLDTELMRHPKTDEDFGKLDLQIKAMKDAEAKLDAAEAQMLAQVQTIDQAKRTKDMLAKLLRDNRLLAQKILADEKERRRGEIVSAGVTALREHIAKLNTRFPRPLMPATCTAVDFGGAIKNKRELSKMEDAIAVTLANAKIAANEVADGIDRNIRHLEQQPKEYAGLFADLDRLVVKAPDDFAAVVSSRIGEARAAAERRAAELAEKARERIRAEEAARLQREQQEQDLQRQAEEQRAREALARQAAQAATPAPTPAPVAIAPPVAVSQAAAASPNVVPMARAAAPASPPSLMLREINARIAPLSITADGLAKLGFSAAGKQGAAVLFHESDFGRMVDSAVAHLRMAAAQRAAA